MANTGKSSEDIFEAHIESLGGFADRLSDLLDAAKQKKVTTRKPADFIVTLNGQMEYAEVKSVLDKDRFSFSGIQPAQWRTATRAVKSGGSYYFYVHFIAFDKWCKIPAKVILNSDKKSITMREAESYTYAVT